MTILLSDTTLTLNTAANVDQQGYSLNDVDWIELQNASPYACKVKIGNQQVLMPAWYDFPIPCALYNDQGTRRVLPGLSLPFTVTPYLQTIPGSGFTQTLHSILYLRGEQPPITTPQPLGGSPVNLSVATSLINTNDAAGNVEVLLIPHGDSNPAGAVRILNSAEIILGDAAYMGILSLIMNGGDSFLLEANGWTQTDSAGANVSTMSDTGIFSVGSANHNGAVQITGTSLVSLIMNIANGLLIADTTGTTATQLNTAGVIAAGNANAAGELKLKTTGGFYDLDMTPVAGTINGSTSGSLTYWQIFKGSGLKLVLVSYSNFRNGGASNQPLAFPTAFATFQCIITSNIPTGTQLWNGGGVTNVGQMIFSTVGGTNGTESSQATIVQNCVASHLGAADTLQHLSGQAAAWNGWAIIIGV